MSFTIRKERYPDHQTDEAKSRKDKADDNRSGIPCERPGTGLLEGEDRQERHCDVKRTAKEVQLCPFNFAKCFEVRADDEHKNDDKDATRDVEPKHPSPGRMCDNDTTEGWSAVNS